MLNKTLREFLLPYTEAQRPEVLKLVLLHGTLCLQKTFGQKRLTIAELRRVVERGHYAITIEEGVPALGQEMQGLKQMLADFERDLGALQATSEQQAQPPRVRQQPSAPPAPAPAHTQRPRTADAAASVQMAPAAEGAPRPAVHFAAAGELVESPRRPQSAPERRGPQTRPTPQHPSPEKVTPEWWGDGSDRPSAPQSVQHQLQPRRPPRLAYSVQPPSSADLAPPLYKDDLVSTEYLAVPGSGYGQHHGAHNSPGAAAGPSVLQSLAPSRQQQPSDLRQAGSLTHQGVGYPRSGTDEHPGPAKGGQPGAVQAGAAAAARDGPDWPAGGKENAAAMSAGGRQRQKGAKGVGHFPVQSRVRAQLEQQRLLSRQREVTRQQRLREAVGGREQPRAAAPPPLRQRDAGTRYRTEHPPIEIADRVATNRWTAALLGDFSAGGLQGPGRAVGLSRIGLGTWEGEGQPLGKQEAAEPPLGRGSSRGAQQPAAGGSARETHPAEPAWHEQPSAENDPAESKAAGGSPRAEGRAAGAVPQVEGQLQQQQQADKGKRPADASGAGTRQAEQTAVAWHSEPEAAGSRQAEPPARPRAAKPEAADSSAADAALDLAGSSAGHAAAGAAGSSAEHAEAGPAVQEMPDLRQQRRRQAAAWCGDFGHLDTGRFTRQTSNALRADMLSKRDHPPPRAQEHVEEHEGTEPQVLHDHPEPNTDASSDSGRWDWDKILMQ